MLVGLRTAPLQDYETGIPPLPSWTTARLEELSAERARSVAESGVRVIGDPRQLRYTVDEQAPDLAEPPQTLPTAAAAGALEGAFAGMLKREAARQRALSGPIGATDRCCAVRPPPRSLEPGPAA